MTKIALVTGANRGLGLGTCRELAGQGIEVVLASRDARLGEAAAAKLASEGRKVTFHPLDVASAQSIDEIASFVTRRFGRLDILVNNAGILPDASVPALEAPLDNVRRTFETNTLGPFQLCQKFLPLMKEKGYGRIVNVSSGMGQLSEMAAGYPAYRLSKTALNAVTRIFAAEAQGTDVLVNSICPGWVKTDMGGPGASRTIEQGIDGIVWAATLPAGGPTAGFFRDRKPIAW